MATPQPETTPATAVEVADKEDIMRLSDNAVKFLAQLETKINEQQKTMQQLVEQL
ncbi:hypothetical protein FVEG_14936 [Fusarium verticillioides 7600]|uniref:Uncharacterized protein n=1 Tax=Gibberella moniliformis (strain M3125 / FGSC 7600) TaxID=334819 RepID=W7LT54_GIBM7|nr:hypothetical protein FVEG_14936 [Fusarium verticillioides 7600]EWG38659.1 hypothetical protein FVEG_14936 [Fusarium verticillioides 7600]